MKEPTTATERFHRWGMTPVETAQDDESDRVGFELHNWGWHRDRWADYRLSLVRHSHLAIRHWLDCCDLYRRIGASLISTAKAFRMAQSVGGS
jgi:hypothetical protein